MATTAMVSLTEGSTYRFGPMLQSSGSVTVSYGLCKGTVLIARQ